MTKILKTEIKSCRDCPNKESTNFWSSDGWDRMEDWECKLVPTPEDEKNKHKKIQGAVEWHEESKIPIPSWCPLEDKPKPEWKDYDNPIRGDMDPQSWGDDIPEPRREMGG